MTGRLRRGWRTTVAGLAAGMALASCGVAGDDPRGARAADAASMPAPATAGPSTAGSPSGSAGAAASEPTPDVPVEPPPTGACYDLDFDEVTAPTSDHPPVPCSGPHTTQTILVGHLDTVVDGHLAAVDSRLAQRRLAEACPPALASHLGGSRRDRQLSRFAVVWFSPTLEQSDLGASWFRCDVVAIAAPEEVASLPRPGRLSGILERPRAAAAYGLCGTAAPGSPRFERVICARPHSWRALSVIPIAGGGDYPGAARVRRAGEDRCRDRVRRESGSTERFRYGWEWPTRQQWTDGQRHGFCWAPD